jgi:hypothetical protein
MRSSRAGLAVVGPEAFGSTTTPGRTPSCTRARQTTSPMSPAQAAPASDEQGRPDHAGGHRPWRSFWRVPLLWRGAAGRAPSGEPPRATGPGLRQAAVRVARWVHLARGHAGGRSRFGGAGGLSALRAATSGGPGARGARVPTACCASPSRRPTPTGRSRWTWTRFRCLASGPPLYHEPSAWLASWGYGWGGGRDFPRGDGRGCGR